MSNQITRYQYLVEAVRNHNSNECLIWPFSLNNKGYARIVFEGRTELIHRIAYLLIHGVFPVPCGMHACDTPACFNPRHIYPGTKLHNNRDRRDKGRGWLPKGETNPFAKLTEDQIKEMIQLRKELRLTQYQIAERFGISRVHVGHILRGEAWSHIERPEGVGKKLEQKCERSDWVHKVIREHTGNGCILWPFATTSFGYGRVRVHGRYVMACALAYFVRHGSYPSGYGSHNCPSVACINPVHVYREENSQGRI